MCIQFTWNQEDIEDNYSEALVNFYRYIESYNPQRPLKTWIYAVTKRLLSDLNSRNQNRLLPNDNIDVQDLAGVLPDEDEPNENYLGMDNYREHYNDTILAALDQLKPAYREALLLQQAGYKLGEIMEIAYRNGSLKNRNIETVKSRLFLAKSQMRKLLTRDGEARKE
ncbi:MAG: RNA polymerase sigma factor [Phocaeicola dorei]|nr:RNA polymerase sigma factor [Phocaeicola dorei]